MPPTQRLPFLDNLRIVALGLLILYHVGMYYVGWDWHVKSAHRVDRLETIMLLLEPWRMSLLFLISGVVTGLVLPGAAPGWLRSRMGRLGKPLLLGVLVVVPPQAWRQVQEQLAYAGGYLDFLQLYYTGFHGFCDALGHCLVLPTWNHLWFLPYLMVYTLLLWAALRRWPSLLNDLGVWLAPRLGAMTLLWVPWMLLTALRAAILPWFEVTHDLVGDPMAHAMYLPMFWLGAVWARTPGIWSTVARLRWWALGLWLGGWAMFIVTHHRLPWSVLTSGYALQQWCGVLAALGFGQIALSATGPWQKTLSGLVFPVYVLHQTFIIALAMALRPLDWSPALEAPLLVILTLGLSVALALAARRVRWLRPWLGWVKA